MSRRVLGLVVLLLLARPAVEPAAGSLPAQETHVLVVVGLGGTPEYRDTFHGWAMDLREAATDELGVPESHVVYLGEDPSIDPDAVRARSTRDNLEAAVAEIAVRARPDDRILVVLLGHGSARGAEGRFNLPGPDVTGTDMAGVLDGFGDRSVALVNAAPASGSFVEPVSGPGRVVVTATRTAREQNETHFGRFFVEAFRGGGADLDKDGRISLLEAFEYARQEVARFYEERNLLLTEHALLDDDGDGVGSEAPDPATGEGGLARSFRIGGDRAVAAGEAEPGAASVDPELQGLYEERDRLQDEIDQLRARESSMERDTYERALEDLLVELALVSRRIREIEGGGS